MYLHYDTTMSTYSSNINFIPVTLAGAFAGCRGPRSHVTSIFLPCSSSLALWWMLSELVPASGVDNGLDIFVFGRRKQKAFRLKIEDT